MDMCVVFFLFFVYSLQLFSQRKKLNGNVYNKFNAALLGKFCGFFVNSGSIAVAMNCIDFNVNISNSYVMCTKKRKQHFVSFVLF